MYEALKARDVVRKSNHVALLEPLVSIHQSVYAAPSALYVWRGIRTWAGGPGYVRLKARVVGEVKVLFRYTLSGL